MKLSLDSPADQMILGALRRGDRRRAATLLVESFAAPAYQLCRLATPAAGEAEELCCAAFAKAFAALSTLRDAATPGSWMLGHLRDHGAAALIDGAPADAESAAEQHPRANASAEGEAVRVERESSSQGSAQLEEDREQIPALEPLRRALATLPPAQRAALALADCGGQLLVGTGDALAAGQQWATLAAEATRRLQRALASRGTCPTREALSASLVELRWPLSEELQRRLGMLCAAL